MIKISDEARDYLVIQHGSVSDYRHHPPTWEERYVESIMRIYENIRPHLPRTCESIVDVGGGLSGISVLLSRHYDGRPRVLVVDGIEDPPVVVKHARTFSNAAVAKRFLKANGVSRTEFISPEVAGAVSWSDIDLCISFASYCFHYPPETYANIVRGSKTKILDVRLVFEDRVKKLFGPSAVIYDAVKFKRHVWNVQ